MEPRQITIVTLKKLLKQLLQGTEDSVGDYLHKGLHIRVSKFQVPTNDRVLELYHKRRNQGLCVVCGKKVEHKNLKTGKLYRMCNAHRKKVDFGY